MSADERVDLAVLNAIANNIAIWLYS